MEEGHANRRGAPKTTGEVASRYIGQSAVGAPIGEPTITGCGTAAAMIFPR